MDQDHLRDLFAGLPQLSIRRMFGGLGLYSEGRVFALGAFDEIWIKVDAQTQPLFEEAGSHRFTYQGRDRTVQLPYWSLPDEALDDPEQALKWARLGLAASLRALKASPGRTAGKRRAEAPRSIL
jgi:DNA transformation protein